jgi:hypothetical protein
MRCILELEMGRPKRWPFRVFLSSLPDGRGGYEGVLREHDPSAPWLRSDLYLVKHNSKGVLVEEIFLCSGEDPRVFRIDKKLLAWTWSFDGEAWQHRLLDLENRVAIPITSSFGGKNFMPFLAGNDVMVIENLYPLVVSRLTDDPGDCKRIIGTGIEASRKIGPYRGGAAATYDRGIVSGFGHYAKSFDIHQPFAFSFDFTAEHPEVRTKILSCCDAICDPTSQFIDPVFGPCLQVCKTTFRWSVTQPVQSLIYQLEPGDEIPKD